MKFRDIPGHERLKSDLRSLVNSGHIPHAIMISGPSGSGKMMLARAYAQYLHCEHPTDGEPCGVCRSCRLHQDLSHPDLHFIYPIVKNDRQKRAVSADLAEEWGKMLRECPAMSSERWLELLDAKNSQPAIYVSDANEIVLADSYPPYTSKYKIFIIWQPERLQPAAANKLLKVIEEPSDGTLFILVSNNELQLLPTIFSRVQRFHAGRQSDTDIAAYLSRRHGLDAELAARYARLCNGSIIRADELGSNTGENEKFLTVYQELMRSAYAKRVARLKSLSEEVAAYGREKTQRFLIYVSRMIRENFIYNMKTPSLTAMTPEEETFSSRFSPFINHLNIEDFAAETDRARTDISRNANAKLVLFDYFLICIILLHRKPKS